MNEQFHDYGNCGVCGEKMIEQQIQQDFWVKGNLIVIEEVPAGVCPQCGEKVVKADVGRQIAAMLTNHRLIRPIRNISVPVIQFRQAA